ARMRINLGWPGRHAGGESKRSPRTGSSTTGSPPLYKNKELSSRSEHQKPASRGPAGFWKGKTEREPCLQNIMPDDLSDPRRTEVLREQAIRKGFIGRSEADQLRFHAAAEHARRFGALNPCGLFVITVRHRRWQVVTLDEEDTARRKLRW